ncbi:MAG: FKBP-type peptidyl-prolyl cis-trans isomerase [Bacteroidota bacterium]
MKYFQTILGLLLSLFLFYGCNNQPSTEEQAQIDRLRIEDYVKANNLVGEFTEDGIFYRVSSGADTAAVSPGLGDSLYMEYTGSFLNNEVFDRSDGPDSLALSRTIEGWRLALPLFNEGSEGYFILPSESAYGPTGFSIIPPNTVLRFDIRLIEVF